MTDSQPPRVRRTQQERREQTIRRLLDAARESLIEVGYARTSIQQICSRAGVSHGGLFRHFPTRMALIVAVADEVSNALIDDFRRRFEAQRLEKDPIRLALGLLRANCRARDNGAWFELIMAARTDGELREALRPIWEHNHARTREFAMAMFPELMAGHPDFADFVDCIVQQFHGEAINAFVMADPNADRRRLDCTLETVRRYALALPGPRYSSSM